MSHAPGDVSRFDSNRDLAAALAGTIAADLTGAICRRGRATLAVSGGSTPGPLFERLSRCPLDWERITVIPVDERWVDERHADSNARMIREHLLQHAGSAASFIGMKTPARSPFGVEPALAKTLAPFTDRIDVVVLGMGEDGHTASFFPGADTLSRALDPAGEELCIAVRPPAAPHDRMTLSLAVLLRAGRLYLHIVGESKWKTLVRAAGPGTVEELPVRGVLRRERAPLRIYYAKGN